MDRMISNRIMSACALLLFVFLFAGCGGGSGGGVDEDTQPDQWGSPGTGDKGIPVFWTRLGGDAYSGAESIVEAPDHGFISVGFRQADGPDAATGSVLKFSSSGAIQWEKEFSDPGFGIFFNCIRKTSDGGYVLGGWHRSATDNTDPGNYLVHRIDADGNALPGWPKVYDKTYSYGVTSVCESKDGSESPDGFVFVGNTNNQSGDLVFFVEKINLNGEFQWKKACDPPLMFGTDTATSIVPDGNQGFIVAGAEGNERLTGYDELNDRVWVDRIGADGTSLAGWPKLFGPGAATSVKKTPDGGFVLAGASFSLRGSKNNDVLVMKINAQGDVEWKRSFGGNNTTDGGSDIDLCSDGGYIVSGGTDSYDPANSSPASEVFLIRLDAEGKALWQKVKGRTSSFEGAGGVVAASDGGFAIAGQAGGSFLVAKFDSAGNTINLGENDYTMTVTGTTGIINSMNAPFLAGRSVSAVNQSTLVGGFGLDTLIKVRDNPALNGAGGLTISPAPVSIQTGSPYVITMNNYATNYGGANLTMTGTMTVSIDSVSGGTLAAGGTYTAEATLSAINVTVKDSEDLLTTFAGDLLLHREASPASMVQRATNVTSGTLSITGDGATMTMGSFWNITSTNLSTGAYLIYTGNTMLFQISGTSGNLSFTIGSPVLGTNPISPNDGNAVITADDDSTAKMTVSTGGNVKLEVDTDADGTIDSTILTDFDKLF
jgi:hypothetical protein